MFFFKETVALVTGAARRVGREIAIALAREGCDIVIHYRDSANDAEDLADEIRRMGREAWDRAGKIDMLVNNAACYTRETLADAGESDFDYSMRVNAFAPIMLAREMALLTPADRGGVIINILDRDISRRVPGRLPYWLSKKALEAATLGLAAELAPRFTVNAIAPGPVLAADDPAEREPAGMIPLSLRPTPANVAECVLFLARSHAITGQIIYADGGQHLA